MNEIIIREACAYDAEPLLEYLKQIGDGSLNALPRRTSHRATLGISVLRSEWNQGIGSRLMNQI